MSISRLLPKTPKGLKQALDKALAKNLSIVIGDRIINGPLAGRLVTQKAVQTDKMHDLTLAKRNYFTYTKTVMEAFGIAKELIASFFKGMFRIVKVVDKLPADVTFYHIAESNMVAPKVNSYADATLQGEYVTVGETDRTAAGGTAMSNPTGPEVGTGVDDLDAKLLVHSSLKEVVVGASSALAIAKPESKKVVKKVWDTVGTAFDEGTEEQKRNICREYGIVYVSTIKKIFNIIVLNFLTGLPINRPLIELIDTGLTRTGGTDGRAAMPSTITASATFSASCDGFTDADVTIEVSEDILVYTVTIRLHPIV